MPRGLYYKSIHCYSMHDTFVDNSCMGTNIMNKIIIYAGHSLLNVTQQNDKLQCKMAIISTVVNIKKTNRVY